MRIRNFVFIIFFLSIIPTVKGQPQAENYSYLSEIPSAKLMEEGREYFEKREAAKALSRFLVVGGRSSGTTDKAQLELSVRALNNAGCVYKYFYYDYPRAYEYFTKAYELCDEIGYQSFLPVILVNLGDLLSDYGMTYDSQPVMKKAESLFDDCFEKAIKDKNWELLTTSFFNLSSLDYNINLPKYKAIFSKEIPAGTPDIEFVRLQYMGIKNLQDGRYKEAREFFTNQLEVINTPWEASRDSICSYINIAETYKREKDFKEEARFLTLALACAESSEIIDLESEIARMLTDCYEELGDSTQALKYHAVYLENRELIHNARLANIGELEYISDLREEEAKTHNASIKNWYLTILVIVLVVLLVVIVLSLAIILKKNRVLKEKNQSLFDKYRLFLEADSQRKGEKYVHSSLDDSKKEELIRRIGEVMNDSDRICREDFSSKELAQAVASNTTYVSQVINEKYGISFSTLLSNSRIKIVCHRISDDPQYQKLTIEAIANSVGFKSRTAFINAFKREVGLTPSQYIKMAAEKQVGV